MRLPNAESAIIDDAKVRDYLLSGEHPIGRFKARVFAAAGYRRDVWERLRDDLLLSARTSDFTVTRSDGFGQRFAGTGELALPTGDKLRVTTVWIISSVGVAPRLITAYPGEGV